MKSLKMDKYFQIKNQEYVYLKLIPNTSVRNNSTHMIAEIINCQYKNILDRFSREAKCFSLELPSKTSYIIDITKHNVCFYILVSKAFSKELSQKLLEVFGKITIEEVEGIPFINSDCTQYAIEYAKDDSLSLRIDKRDNDLLTANLTIMNVLENKDRMTVIYNFIPQSKFSLRSWKNYHQDMMLKYNKGSNMDKSMTSEKIISSLFKILFNSLDMVINSVQSAFDSKAKREDSFTRFVPVQELSKNTIKKENATIVNTQIMIYSQSDDKGREKENAKMMVNTFDVIKSTDNKLIGREITKKTNVKVINIANKDDKRAEFLKQMDNYKQNNIKILSKMNKNKLKIDKNELNTEIKEYKVVNIEGFSLESNINKMSTDELSNAIELPGRELINNHSLQAVKHLETNVPEELTGGNIIYGTNTCQGNVTQVTSSTDIEAACMPDIFMSKMGGGKSSLGENIGVESINNNESFINIDFVKNCEVSDNIIRNIDDPSKVVVVDFSDDECMEGFGFNEINEIRDESNPISIYKCAVLQNAQITEFIDNLGDEEFSASMGRYLDAACTAVLIHRDKSIKDIVKCLEDYKARGEYVSSLEEFSEKMPDQYKELIYEDIAALEELDEYKGKNKDEVSGTNVSKISGIISRMSMMKKNPALKFMYVRSTKNNINLVDLMQSGKAIFFKLPQHEFSTPTIKNVMVSYLFSKIMLASEIRAKKFTGQPLTKVNVMCDEIQQAKGSFKNISYMAYQVRKFRVKLILFTHGFDSIAPIKDTLIDAGAGIFMLKGTSVKNFDVMKNELEGFGFTKEDLISLSHTSKYKALCLIATQKGRHGCIIELPKPVSNKIEINISKLA